MQEVIDKYINILSAHVIEKDSICVLCHVKWMLAEMSNWGPTNHWDKLNRWLGFVQGAFWCEDVYSIEEMKEHNRPPRDLESLEFLTALENRD